MKSWRNRTFVAVGLGVILPLVVVMIVVPEATNSRMRNIIEGGKLRANCGPVALKMVFDHYDVECSLAEITERMDPAPGGSRMLSLKTMAEAKGLATEGWLLRFDDLRKITFPAIAFVNGNHYVVVDSISENGTVFARDARGRKMFSQEKFLQAWHGETLVVLGPMLAGTPRVAGTKRTNSQSKERILP